MNSVAPSNLCVANFSALKVISTWWFYLISLHIECVLLSAINTKINLQISHFFFFSFSKNVFMNKNFSNKKLLLESRVLVVKLDQLKKNNTSGQWKKITFMFIWEKKLIFHFEITSILLHPLGTYWKKPVESLKNLSGWACLTTIKSISLRFILSQVKNICKKNLCKKTFIGSFQIGSFVNIMIKESCNLIDLEQLLWDYLDFCA